MRNFFRSIFVLGVLMQASAVAADSPPSRLAIVRELQAFLLAHGKYNELPAEYAKLGGLNDGESNYRECLVAWQDDNDKTIHLVFAGIDNDRLVLSFKSADRSSVVDWTVNGQGQLLRTLEGHDNSGVHTVSNDKYADRLDGELDYWRTHLVQLPADGSCTQSGR